RVDAGGQVTLGFVIKPDGTTEGVAARSSPASDPPLEECLRAALAEIQFPAVSAGITVTLPLEMAPPPAAAPLAARATIADVEASARGALEAGDGITASRRYAALARQAPSCAHDVGLLRALMIARPWLDDGVMAAAVDFVDSAPGDDCVALAAPLLTGLATAPHRLGAKLEDETLIELALERYRVLLRLPNLANADELRTYQADALLRLGFEAQAQAILSPGAKAATPRPPTL
ncbi:MAG TPA: hypothetical protein VMZ28_16620, partial [Kofleriaceae bacterium]|nr:hypothetical protein [Kofleriaceae bacterium]